MFGKRHKEENIRLKDEIDKLNEEIQGLNQEIEAHGDLTVLSTIQMLSALNVDMMMDNIADDVEQMVVHSFMRSGEVDEAFLDVKYGVEVQIQKTDGSLQVISQFPIHSIGDGCFISKYAVSRRQNIVFLTRSIADFVKMEIERGCDRVRRSMKVIRTEEWIDNLLEVCANPSEEEKQ